MTTRAHPLPQVSVSRHIVIRKWHVAAMLGLIAITAGIIHSRQTERIPILTSNPIYEDIESTVATTGSVIPVNDFPARANFSGIVEKVFVKLGQKVQAGQMLIQMKDQYAYLRVANARAALDAAEVNSENVQTSGSQEDHFVFASDLLKARTEESAAASALATLKQLAVNGSASESEVAAGALRLQAANATLNTLMQQTTERYSKTDIESWKAKVEADKASVTAEQISYENAHIRSPIRGTVYVVAVAPNDFVSIGSDLLHVADLSKLHIYADFDELDVRKLREGEPVRITWDGNPNRSWEGRVVEAPLAVTGPGPWRVGRATIEINDKNGDLPVNTTVTVSVTLERHAHVLTIPREALRLTGSEYYVYRLFDDRLEKLPVQVGVVTAMKAEITKGLGPSDEVALHAAGGERLEDHMWARRAN